MRGVWGVGCTRGVPGVYWQCCGKWRVLNGRASGGGAARTPPPRGGDVCVCVCVCAAEWLSVWCSAGVCADTVRVCVYVWMADRWL